MSRANPTPPKALAAFDLCVETGFATIEEGLDAIDGTLERLAAAGGRPTHVSTTAWFDVIRERAGTDWKSLLQGPRKPWRGTPFAAVFRADPPTRLQTPSGRFLSLPACSYVALWQPWQDRPEFGALYCAHEVLRAEKRCRVKDVDRALHVLRRGTEDFGRVDPSVRPADPTSAFDWYLKLVRTIQGMGVTVLGLDLVDELVAELKQLEKPEGEVRDG